MEFINVKNEAGTTIINDSYDFTGAYYRSGVLLFALHTLSSVV